MVQPDLSGSLCVCLSVCPSARPSVILSVCLSICPSVRLSVRQSVCQSVPGGRFDWSRGVWLSVLVPPVLKYTRHAWCLICLTCGIPRHVSPAIIPAFLPQHVSPMQKKTFSQWFTLISPFGKNAPCPQAQKPIDEKMAL